MEAMSMDDIKAATANGAKVNPRTGCVIEPDPDAAAAHGELIADEVAEAQEREQAEAYCGCDAEDEFKYTPDADGVQMDRSFMEKAQKIWGCDKCQFADANKVIGDQGLCQFPGQPYNEDGNCVKRR